MQTHSHQAPTDPETGRALGVKRHFTTAEDGPYAEVTWVRRDSKIARMNGEVIFEQNDVEVPSTWSQTAVNVLAQKYFRKRGVPTEAGCETSARQVMDRLAKTWRYWGDQYGYFESADEAQAFEDEVAYMLIHQIAAPNSPQFFSTGLAHMYGITGDPQGHWYVEESTGEMMQGADAYSRPTPHACFIQSINDDLVNEGGIFDTLTKEARVFKFGAGSGLNYSNLRGSGESLTGGGKSSGLMSFLKIFDAAAGAIKSGGTTRRSARMVVVDIDHPEIEDFINWKVEEERKVAALVAAGYPSDYEGEAYRTVSGQNANNSVRVTDDFMMAVENDADWDLYNRTDGQVYKTVRARDLWEMIVDAAWRSADPGLQFHDTVNRWNTCINSGEIKATNPCGEYNFLDNTACNLASLNLVKFIDRSKRDNFDMKSFEHAVRIWTIVLDISVSMAQLPSREIAQGTYDYRTLGLGYANLGALLMRMGLPYDSDEGRDVAAGITSMMTATAYHQSAVLAGQIAPFPRYLENRWAMDGVIQMHQEASDHVRFRHDDIQRMWSYVHNCGRLWGFRNAQTTLLAPTGTIGLLMDCDTTGIEPDYSLIKYKALSGGGDMKIVNQSVRPALISLGYSREATDEIVAHIDEHGTLEDHDYVRYLPDDEREDVLAVFDCANRCGTGTRFIQPMGHVKMMGAIQPFLSGSASKTINLPHEATHEDIGDVYWQAWKLGIKCVALYRDGSKLSQPLSSTQASDEPVAEPVATSTNGHHAEVDLTYTVPMITQARRKLPGKRYGFTQEVMLAGHKIFIRTGEYEDGSLGEIFVDLHKEGAALRSLMGCFSIAVSKGLQYGVPLEEFAQSFIHQRFEPQGMVQGHPNIKMSTSIIDLIFRVLALEYLDQHDVAQVPPETRTVNVTQSVLGNGHAVVTADEPVAVAQGGHDVQDSQDAQLQSFESDAPFCPECGHLTLRSGNCYRCLNCGESLGCS